MSRRMTARCSLSSHPKNDKNAKNAKNVTKRACPGEDFESSGGGIRRSVASLDHPVTFLTFLAFFKE